MIGRLIAEEFLVGEELKCLITQWNCVGIMEVASIHPSTVSGLDWFL